MRLLQLMEQAVCCVCFSQCCLEVIHVSSVPLHTVQQGCCSAGDAVTCLAAAVHYGLKCTPPHQLQTIDGSCSFAESSHC